VVISGWDLPLRGFLVFLAALPVALAVTAIVWVLFAGEYALALIPAVEIAVFWLIEARARSGLRLRTYQTILDSQRAQIGTFFCCWRVIDPLAGRLGVIVASSIPVVLAERPTLIETPIDAQRGERSASSKPTGPRASLNPWAERREAARR
jgi:hypothetical protein